MVLLAQVWEALPRHSGLAASHSQPSLAHMVVFRRKSAVTWLQVCVFVSLEWQIEGFFQVSVQVSSLFLFLVSFFPPLLFFSHFLLWVLMCFLFYRPGFLFPPFFPPVSPRLSLLTVRVLKRGSGGYAGVWGSIKGRVFCRVLSDFSRFLRVLSQRFFP